MIFANGPVSLNSALSGVIVCDGDVKVDSALGGSIVIARGNVNVLSSSALKCAIFAGGSVRDRLHFPTLGNVIRQHERHAFGLVRFFETTDVGATVAADKGGVRVKAVDVSKPLGKAGLRAGDLVLRLHDATADSPESFRRLLRTRVAEGGDAVLRVRRDGKEVEVRVSFP